MVGSQFWGKVLCLLLDREIHRALTSDPAALSTFLIAPDKIALIREF
jgi:hypothetical protein